MPGTPIDPVGAWHAYMRAPTPAALEALIADDCVFQSPAVHTPQIGKAVTLNYHGGRRRAGRAVLPLCR